MDLNLVASGFGPLLSTVAAASTVILAGVVVRRFSSRRARAELQQATSAMSRVRMIVQGDINQINPFAHQEPEQRRIEQIGWALRESQVLINELQTEMDTKVAVVERLRAEEEQSRQLASLREDEARAVRNLISATIDSAHMQMQQRLEHERDELRANLAHLQEILSSMQKTGRRDQILFFVIGVGVSIPIGIVVNVLF